MNVKGGGPHTVSHRVEIGWWSSRHTRRSRVDLCPSVVRRSDVDQRVIRFRRMKQRTDGAATLHISAVYHQMMSIAVASTRSISEAGCASRPAHFHVAQHG